MSPLKICVKTQILGVQATADGFFWFVFLAIEKNERICEIRKLKFNCYQKDILP